MGFLENFEQGLERFVNRAFTRTFKSELQPVEIAAAIRSEMDAKASILSRDRILAPNTYTVRLSSPDFNRMRALGDSLIQELNVLATRHAQKQGFQFGAALQIRVVEDSALGIGELKVGSTSEQVAVEWTPLLVIGGKNYPLTKPATSVGRDSSADIQVDDSGLSRRHFEIVWDGQRAGVRDLGSTNGTKVNGRNISQEGIASDAVISAGRTDFVFKIVAKAVAGE